jgi:hypothetical protein
MLVKCNYSSMKTYSISGTVRLCGEGSPGVDVEIVNDRFGRFAGTTGDDGSFTFEEVWPGEYTLTVMKDDLTFTPGEKKIKVIDKDLLYQDFISIVTWSKQYEENTGGEAYSINPSTDCGYILAGNKKVPGSDPNNYDFWLLKLDMSGNIQWSKTFGGSYFDSGFSAVETMDGGFVAAGETYSKGLGCSDIWIIKLDSRGNLLWERTYGGERYDHSYSIHENIDGSYAVAGSKGALGNVESFLWFFTVSRDDGSIIEQVEKAYGSLEEDRGLYVVQTLGQDNYGGYVLAGDREYDTLDGTNSDALVIKLDSGLEENWFNVYKGNNSNYWNKIFEVRETADSGYICAGYTDSSLDGSTDIWIYKLNLSGEKVWENVIDRGFSEKAYSVSETSDNGYIAAGFMLSPRADNDFFIVKLDESGGIMWEKTYSGLDGSFDEIHSIFQTRDGGYIFAGNTETFDGQDRVWVIKTDSDGNIVEEQ